MDPIVSNMALFNHHRLHRSLPFIFLLLLVSVSIGTTYATESSETNANARKSAHISLHASWNATSPAAEAALYIYEMRGIETARQFLTGVADLIKDESQVELTEQKEVDTILQVITTLFDENQMSIATLEWVLSSRLYSPNIFLQYSLSQYTHTSNSIFFIAIDQHKRKAYIITNPQHLIHVSENQLHKLNDIHIPNALYLHDGNHLPLSVGNNLIQDLGLACILYAHPMNNHLHTWLSLLDQYHVPFSMRFMPPDVPYANAFPSLQSYVAHGTLRKTEYKVVDDRVYKTRLFDDCPFENQLLCESTSRPSSSPTNNDEYAWPAEEDEKDDDDMKYSSLESMTFIKQYALDQSEGNQLSVSNVINSLSFFIENSASITRSNKFHEVTQLSAPSKEEEKTLLKSIRQFRSSIGDSSNFVMINGFYMDAHELTQGISKVLKCLSKYSIVSQYLKRMLIQNTNSVVNKNSKLRIILPSLHDKSHKANVYLNNMYKDSRYKKWKKVNVSDSQSIEKFINDVEKQSTSSSKSSNQQQHLKLVKYQLNHLSIQFILDPANLNHLPYLSVPETIIKSDLPFEVSIFFIPNSPESKLIIAAFQYLLQVNGRKTAIQFLSMIGQVIQYFGQSMDMNSGTIPVEIINMAFQQIMSQSNSLYESPQEILEMEEDVQHIIRDAHQLADDLKLYNVMEIENNKGDIEVVQQGSFVCLLNGILIKDIGKDLLAVAIQEQQRIAKLFQQEAVQSGMKVGDGDNEDHIQLDQLSIDQWISFDNELLVIKKLNKNMLKSTNSNQNDQADINVSGDDLSNIRIQTKDILPFMNNEMSSIEYLNNMDNYKITIWIIDNGHTKNLQNLIQTQASTSDFSKQTYTRYAIISESKYPKLCHAIYNTMDKVHNVHMDNFMVMNGKFINANNIENIDDLNIEIASEFQESYIPDHVQGESRLLYRLFNLEISSVCSFSSSSHNQYQQERYPSEDEVEAAIEKSNEIYPLTISSPSSENDETILKIHAIIDPTDKHSFILSSLLQTLLETYDSKHMKLTVGVISSFENARRKQTPPLTYYKYHLSSKLFIKSSSKRFANHLTFNNLPQNKVLTIAIDTPRSWFVSSYATNHDMDNIILDSLPNQKLDLFAEYSLKNLIVEGSCIDENNKPPQGLKLILTNNMNQDIKVDTIVMANLGYFQLKVPYPGIWLLKLAKGRSSTIYQLKSMQMFSSISGIQSVGKPDSDGQILIPVDSLNGAGGILLKVVRKPGMKGKSVLQSTVKQGENNKDKVKDEDEDTAHQEKSSSNSRTNRLGKLKQKLGNFVSNMKGGKQNEDEDEDDLGKDENDDMIHVFSVASGHLYERFLKIMISSVTKNASRKVKFWLLENYLSPPFKKLIPEFCKQHNAEVEFITYKWPGWLRAQEEKQRTIWGYKILFLDVLFPLNIKRIIFVDSDQVIRGDLSELMDINLEGKPYGYVPFCDSRKEVEGYRFWKSGFWKDTLRSEKYRISALYVVDLITFRNTAAGDTLRFIYQSLSADPNSLSNLDQDLPNYASVNSMGGKVVPIFNLPQDWLWCESWCDDESKVTAKAIDLCNNPMTKEPKLVSAKRIIEEWVDIDNNATTLTQNLYDEIVNNYGNITLVNIDNEDNEIKTEL